LAFLKEEEVVVEEKFDSSRNLFLYHNWKAEKDVADGMAQIIKRGIDMATPAWNVDFTR
jgi:hypothetical protein